MRNQLDEQWSGNGLWVAAPTTGYVDALVVPADMRPFVLQRIRMFGDAGLVNLRWALAVDGILWRTYYDLQNFALINSGEPPVFRIFQEFGPGRRIAVQVRSVAGAQNAQASIEGYWRGQHRLFGVGA